MRMLGYIRVSTGDQAEYGHSLDDQRKDLKRAAAQRGWDLTIIEDDIGMSATSMDKRLGLQFILAALKNREFDGLAMKSIDRLSRSMKDTADIMQRAERQGWALVVLDLGIDMTTPAGEYVGNIMAANARWERRIISQRTKDGLAAARAKGVRLGRPVGVPPDVLQRIATQRAEGLSLAKIAAALNEDGIPCATGHPATWHGSTIRAICLRAEERSTA